MEGQPLHLAAAAMPAENVGVLPRCWLLPLACVLLGADLRAGESGASGWQVRVWKTSDGLAGNNVSGIFESADGFLWLVAGGQLTRFDGAAFRLYPMQFFRPGEQAGRIRAFTRLRDGNFAFGLLDATVWRTRAGRLEQVGTGPGDNVRLEYLSEDDAGGLLLVYNDASVWRIRDGKTSRLSEDDGLPPGAHCRFTIDRQGRRWFAKGGYVGLQRGDRFETLQRFPANAYPRIGAASRGGVWIAAADRLYHFDEGGTLTEHGTVPLRTTLRPNALLEDRTGAVWFGTYSAGLFRFENGRCESVPISHRQVVAMMEDREGSVWVTTSGGGLNQVQPRAVTVEGDETGLPHLTVQAVCEDANGQLWGFTPTGRLMQRATDTWQPVTGIDPRGDVCSIAADPAGGLWIATKNSRLHHWHKGDVQSWSRSDGIPDAGTLQLHVSRRGELWLAGTRPASLARWRGDKAELLELPRPADAIRGLGEDGAGNLWLATTGRQLVRVSAAGEVSDVSALLGDTTPPVRAMYVAEDDAVWLGLDQGGLARIKNGRLGRITSRDGLYADNIEFILPDGRGWLWFAASQSIFKASIDELSAVAENRGTRVQSIRYGHDQGVRAVFGEVIGAIRRRDGRLWIPMATSLAIIDPSQRRPHSTPPPVWITALKVDERTLAEYGGVMPVREGLPIRESLVELAPDHRRIDVDFTALSFRTPSNVHFRYRLENFDARWIDAGPRRSVSYSRLVAGDYRLRVQACNSEGVWNEAGATLAWVVRPYFWDTWWFRGLTLLGFTSAVFATTRYVSHRRLRTKLRAAEQEAAVERERTRIARDIHDDLGGRLTKIVLLSGLAEREREAPEKTAERAREISDTARQLIKSLEETVWAVNPRNDTLPHLISYTAQFAVNFLRAAEIACHLDLPDDPPDTLVPADSRHHVFLAVKEALTNVVRHANAANAHLKVTLPPGTLEIAIEDDGVGYSGPSNEAEADGLRNMRERMEQIGGTFRIERRAAGGTRVTLTLPRPGTSAA